jgi:hypothetical protein
MTAETVARIELVKAMARGMALREWPDECTMSDAALFEAQQAHLGYAQAALAAIEAAGCMVVPRWRIGPADGINCGTCGVRLPDRFEYACPDCGMMPLPASPMDGRGE